MYAQKIFAKCEYRKRFVRNL